MAQGHEDAPMTRNNPQIPVPEGVKLDPQSGGGTYEYSIVVPSGTGGLTPELKLIYSSLTGSTEYGMGWSLPIGRIERSTRHGSPRYDDSVDRFEMDGSLLIRDSIEAGRFYRSPHNGDRIVFEAPSRWVVTRPDGTQLRYGSRPATSKSRLAKGENGSGPIFRWQLDEVVDPRGNSYRIEYEPDAYSIEGSPGSYWSYLYPRPKT